MVYIMIYLCFWYCFSCWLRVKHLFSYPHQHHLPNTHTHISLYFYLFLFYEYSLFYCHGWQIALYWIVFSFCQWDEPQRSQMSCTFCLKELCFALPHKLEEQTNVIFIQYFIAFTFVALTVLKTVILKKQINCYKLLYNL